MNRSEKLRHDLRHEGTELTDRADDEIVRLEALEARRMLDYGRQQARCAVFMQAMAALARNGQRTFAQAWVKRADAAAADVRPEDFVTLASLTPPAKPTATCAVCGNEPGQPCCIDSCPHREAQNQVAG